MIDRNFSKRGRDRRESFRIYMKQTQDIRDELEAGDITEEEARKRFKKLRPWDNI
tara:strand:- start:254 stop:418 length:165 start_codon:yes stop_codon:yes gene_type:complete